jgi:hypothetical protein
MTFGMSMEGNETALESLLSKSVAESNGSGEFTYLEIGTHEGLTLLGMARLLESCQQKALLIGIDLPGDPYGLVSQGREKFGRFWAGEWSPPAQVPDVAVKILLERSPDSIRRLGNTPLNLVLIDACHCEQCCINDFCAVEKLVCPGGRVIFHDASPVCQNKPQGNFHGPDKIEVRSSLEKLGLLDDRRKCWIKEVDLVDVPFGICGFKKT